MPTANAAQSIFLSDYVVPEFLVDTVELTFKLAPKNTRVISSISFRQNPEFPKTRPRDFRLNGRNLTLISAAIDGVPLTEEEVLIDAESLFVPNDLIPEQPFVWTAEVEINPQDNTALEGLYMSNGMYCTQCEAQGFRKITYFPDRPDVMATYSVRIEGDTPVMLSNGNPVSLKDGVAEWRDPWPKPSYLFALVAGDLVSFDDQFVTMSGRRVDLRVFVRDGDQDKCAYAMDALKRSMTWDEQVYGREYDLDLFMIVAVDDFNMGAMENKGLNIFNSKYILASPKTATDRDYVLIESIIAHEYFHNWTGNRITCRDWFQLCLKEGLTVFRDQQFSGDMRSHAVKRIESVLQLRARQFREDAGPLSHPVRPSEYIEINNFYTATVYEKGAEVINMLKTLVGNEAYRKALDLYFERHDGQACTIEDWKQVFEDTTGRDLSQFGLWYSQSGTPRVDVREAFENGNYTLTFRQSNNSQGVSKPAQVIPIATGLLNPNGDEIRKTTVLELTKTEQSFTFTGLASKPIPSLLRGFSAPVILNRKTDNQERGFLLTHDTDPFNKWEAGRSYATELLVQHILTGADWDQHFLTAMQKMVLDDTLDPAFRALALSLPSEDELAQAIAGRDLVPDPTTIFTACEKLHIALARHMQADLPDLYRQMQVSGPYTPDAGAAGKRALRAATLALLGRLDHKATAAALQFSGADNMTEQLTALSVLIGSGNGSEAVAAFFDQWKDDRLVIDKWFAIQASKTHPDRALAITDKLTEHPDFDWKNPNRFRSLISGFVLMNPAGFHRPDGAGYVFFADWLIKLDPVNPQTTARMCGGFESWRRYDSDRQAKMQAQLERIANTPGLSKDSSEIVGKILN